VGNTFWIKLVDISVRKSKAKTESTTNP